MKRDKHLVNRLSSVSTQLGAKGHRFIFGQTQTFSRDNCSSGAASIILSASHVIVYAKTV